VAGDWMPMRLDLDEDPAVVAIAAKLDKPIPLIVGGLFRVWRWWHRQSRNGHAAVTLAYLDHHADVPNLARAMVEVGWLREHAAGDLSIPHWDRWMSGSAKKRLLAARRQASKRARDAADNPPKSVTLPSRSPRNENVTRGEESRGATSYTTPTPSAGAERAGGDKPRREQRPAGKRAERAAAWAAVADAMAATADLDARRDRVGPRLAAAVASAGGWTALGQLPAADARRAFLAALRGAQNGHAA